MCEQRQSGWIRKRITGIYWYQYGLVVQIAAILCLPNNLGLEAQHRPRDESSLALPELPEVRVGVTSESGVSVSLLTLKAESSIGPRKALTTPARVVSSAPIWKFRRVKIRPIARISNSFSMVYRSLSTWISILPTGLCIGRIAETRHAATQ